MVPECRSAQMQWLKNIRSGMRCRNRWTNGLENGLENIALLQFQGYSSRAKRAKSRSIVKVHSDTGGA